MMLYLTDTKQHLGINTLALKDFINICAITIQTSRKPGNLIPLASQHILNFLANMNHFYISAILNLITANIWININNGSINLLTISQQCKNKKNEYFYLQSSKTATFTCIYLVIYLF